MNAQSNHPITDTTDPQFLGPEAGQQAGGEEQTYDLTATYSPDDNKLRLSSATRLDRDVYDRVKAAGFSWAPKLDQFIDRAAEEMNPERRRELIRQALAEHNAQIFHVPLHRQVIPWAMRANVYVVHRADNWLLGEWVRID